MRPLHWLKFWLAMGWVFVGIVVFLSLDPSPPELADFQGQDKVMHLLAYTFIMLWFGCCYYHGKTYLALGAGLIGMGIVLELLQGFMGYRSMELWDMVVNTFGVTVGWFLTKTRLSSVFIRVESQLGFQAKR